MNALDVEDRVRLFPKEMPAWMGALNVVTDLLLGVVVIIPAVITFVFMYPDGSWWDLSRYYVRYQYELHVYCLQEVFGRSLTCGFPLAVVMSLLTLIYGIRKKLNWNTCVMWISIHMGMVALVVLVFVFAAPLT